MHRCERCGEANPSDASYCATCGLSLADPGGVSALLAEPDDETGRSSETVGAPAFGETASPVSPRATDDQPPITPPAAAVATTAFPANPGPPPSAGTAVMVAALAIAVVVIVGGLAVLLASNSGGDDSTADSAVTVATGPTPEMVVPSSAGAAVVPPATDAAPAEPTTPVVPTEPAATPVAVPPGPTRGAGDLGLDQPILDEACDGRYITFVGSAVGAEPYADEVATLLAQYPGSNYIWTRACPSLRQEFRDGNDIYGVVYGPYPTLQEACDAVSFGPPDAYVRRISTTDPEDHTVDC